MKLPDGLAVSGKGTGTFTGTGRKRLDATSVTVVGLALALSSGCASPATPPADAPFATDAAAFPELPVPADNPTTEARVELGRQLFHDPLLSSDRQVACVTCHGQIWGLSDALPLSIGVNGSGPPGPGRYGPTHTRRNAMTLWNAAYRATLFWDGRASSLEAQALLPIADPIELNRSPADVVADLRAAPAYRALFAAAFPPAPGAPDEDPITVPNLARALAAFQRTLVSDRAPYDQYTYRGDRGALGDDERHGLELFHEVGCASCHTPPLFESERFERGGARPIPGVTDEGRFEVTRREEDRGRFRVPTLRNLRVTGPYFHNGTSDTIEDAIAQEVAAGNANRALTTPELAALASFLRKSLVDLSRTPSRPVTAPSGLAVPRDTLDVPRWPPGDAGTRD